MGIKKEIGHFFAAARNSWSGLRDISKETAFRQELVGGVVHYALIIILDIPFWAKVVLGALWPMVLAAELINSAVEQVVDHISPEWNEFAKHAKDFCSAAVGLIIATTVGTWISVILKYLI